MAAAKKSTPRGETPEVPYRGDLDIAIVGMACMFPQSPDLRSYWENIMRRIDCIREVPEGRWDPAIYFDEDRFARDKVYSKWGGFLDPIRFDPMKWKFPPSSLLNIDPIQLLSLEVANQAFEDAGYHERPFPKERTGVIFACAGSHDVGSDYAFRSMVQHYLPRVKDLTPELRQHIVDELNATLPEWSEDSFPGFLMNVIAGRIANRFDLGGPNYVVDAACAASLAAVHASIAQLRLKTVDAMLVGAADGTNNPFCYMSFAKTHALSPRGRSRPFDNSADGIALGEGIGAIMIRRLEDAERDGDKIYAVIKGIGASSDGRNRSMTAPFPGGQMKAMERAYADADVPAASVSLVEAHGTGTAVGDSTEITSLHTLFSEATKDEQYAAVGSVKSMIGHTKTCAGIASLIKTTLALKQRVLPPTINVEHPNEKVDFRHSPFFINTETRPWFEELGEHPRRAGVSAFGFGGTNFHVVMEEYVGNGPSQFAIDYSPRSVEICLWQRGTRAELVEALKTLAEQIPTVGTPSLSRLCAAIRHDEAALAAPRTCRLAIVAATIDELRTKVNKAIEQLGAKTALLDPTGIYYSEAAAVQADQVAFLYPGQGSQSVNMLRDLAVVTQWAQAHFTAANRVLADFFPIAITRMIYPPPVFAPEEDEARKARLNETQVAQPALGVVETFGTELLKRFGVTPGAVAGHSYGEYVALYAAGAIGLDDLLKLSGHRGRVASEASEKAPGAMAAVQGAAADVSAALKTLGLPVYLANLNAPDQTIIAGEEAAVETAVAKFTAAGLRAKRIPVTAAFHTPAIAGAVEPLSAALKDAKFQTPKLPVYSNTLAAAYPKKPAEIRKLLQRHIVEPVRFEEQIRQMRADGYEVFVEVGPGRVLSGLIGRIFGADAPATMSLDAPGRDGITQLAHVLGQLFTLGLSIDLAAWYDGRGLGDASVAAYTGHVVETSQPKKHEWMMSVSGAKPVTPLPPRKGLPGDGLRAKFAGKTGAGGTASAASGENGHSGTSPTTVAADTSSHPGTNGHASQPARLKDAVAALETAPVATVRVPSNGHPAPAPLPTQTRFPQGGESHGANGHGANGHGGTNGHANGHATNGHGPHGTGLNGHGTNGLAAHGQATIGETQYTVHPPHGANGNGSAVHPVMPHAQPTNAPVTVAAAPATTTVRPNPTATAAPQAKAATPVPLILPGSAVPMAPCLPVATDWTKPAVAPAATTFTTPSHLNGTQQPKRFAVSTQPSPMNDNGSSLNPAAAQLILQSQALMMQMLDLQKWQQQVALKFVDAHQQLIQGVSGANLDFVGLPAPMIATGLPTPEVAMAPVAAPVAHVAPASIAQPAPAPVARVAPAPMPVAPAPAPQIVTPKPAPVAVTPAVLAPKPVAVAPVAVTPAAVPAKPAPQPVVAKPAPAAVAAVEAVVAKAAPAASSHGIPTPEMFKADLLNAVSERTGYPTDMLDLELPLEAGLGIDSIKTVEIFSNLKPYHPYFQQDDQDEEEALKEFTKLKTLGDIISAYELRHQAVTSGANSPKLADKTGEEVERYTLTAVDAPAGGQKKTSHVNS